MYEIINWDEFIDMLTSLNVGESITLCDSSDKEMNIIRKYDEYELQRDGKSCVEYDANNKYLTKTIYCSLYDKYATFSGAVVHVKRNAELKTIKDII